MAKKIDVAGVGEIPSGEFKIVKANGKEVGVYNDEGVYDGILNVCPHQQDEICKGTVSGTNIESEPHEFIYGKEGKVLSCPWHGWEFDIETGKSIFDPENYRVRTYEVKVEDNRIILYA